MRACEEAAEEDWPSRSLKCALTTVPTLAEKAPLAPHRESAPVGPALSAARVRATDGGVAWCSGVVSPLGPILGSSPEKLWVAAWEVRSKEMDSLSGRNLGLMLIKPKALIEKEGMQFFGSSHDFYLLLIQPLQCGVGRARRTGL